MIENAITIAVGSVVLLWPAIAGVFMMGVVAAVLSDLGGTKK
jgi:hypothetical protein